MYVCKLRTLASVMWGNKNIRESMSLSRSYVYSGRDARVVLANYVWKRNCLLGILDWRCHRPFFENNFGQGITENGLQYRSMIRNFFWLEFHDLETNDIWLQQVESILLWIYCMSNLKTCSSYVEMIWTILPDQTIWSC